MAMESSSAVVHPAVDFSKEDPGSPSKYQRSPSLQINSNRCMKCVPTNCGWPTRDSSLFGFFALFPHLSHRG